MPPSAQSTQRRQYLRSIDIRYVLPDPDQPRKRFSEESIARLAASLDRSGMMYPLRVRPERDRFRLIAGERRYRAAKQAGLQEVQ